MYLAHFVNNALKAQNILLTKSSDVLLVKQASSIRILVPDVKHATKMKYAQSQAQQLFLSKFSMNLKKLFTRMILLYTKTQLLLVKFYLNLNS